MNRVTFSMSRSRAPLNVSSFSSYFLPAILCYYATAYLAVAPLSRRSPVARYALLMITLFATLRALLVRVDVIDPECQSLLFLNQNTPSLLLLICMRCIAWTFAGDLERKDGLPHRRASNAIRLCFDLRGLEWTWSIGLHVPRQRRTTSRAAFALRICFFGIIQLLIFDAVSAVSERASLSQTIFDHSAPPVHRYLLSSFLTVSGWIKFYIMIQLNQDYGTLFGLLLFDRSPLQWPPLFDSPWLATSVAELWSQRWHQLARYCFKSLGYTPMSKLFGKDVGLLAAFGVSGLWHYGMLWAVDRPDGRAFTFFIMMGVGVVLERHYKQITGKKVGGFMGWLWTVVWFVGWAHMLTDAWFKNGLKEFLLPPLNTSFRPGKYIVDRMFPVAS